MKFKNKHDFETRKAESNKIMNKYPSRIPIIIEKCNNCALDEIDKIKYLVPKELKMSQLIYVIRKRIRLNPSETIFLMASENLQLTSSRFVKEIAFHSVKINNFVPEHVIKMFKKKESN